MHERIRFITEHAKEILLVDCSGCTAKEVEELARAVPEVVTRRPRGSVLILTDFTGASFNDEAIRTMKESAIFDKPFIKRSAWIGTEALLEKYRQGIKEFSGRDLPVFTSRQEALAWLVAD